MLCSFAVATAEFVLVGLLPEIATDLAVSVPAAGQLVTVYMLVVTVGGPVATVLTRRLPRRSLLAATMALATAAAALSAAAGSYGVLIVARLGSAVAQALFMAVASQVAMAAAAPARPTAAVARGVGGLAFAPRTRPSGSAEGAGLGGVARLVANRAVLTGLAVTLLTLTGFVAVFTYV